MSEQPKPDTGLQKLRDFDRLVAVCGLGGYRRLVKIVADETTRTYEPGQVLFVGNNVDLPQFCKDVEEAGGDSKRILAFPSRDDAGFETPVCFASRQDTESFISYVQRGIHRDGARVCAGPGELGEKPEPVRLVVQFWSEIREEYLPEFLRRCPEAKVYCVDEFSTLNGLEPRTDLEGWDAVPAAVDLDAGGAEEESLRPIPQEAMFGKLAEIARQTHTPLGYAYPAVLALASVYVQSDPNVRASLYVAPAGDVHSGKTVATDRTRALLSLSDENPLCLVKTPYSDRGLYQLLPGSEFKKRVLAVDEGRAMMAKGSIENSTLISVLCSLWSRNREGGADKKGAESVNVELSIVMNLKVKDESEFPSVFTHATAHGLYDRFLYGVRGGEAWHYTPWDFDPARDAIMLEPTRPRIPGWVFDRAHLWAAADDDRDRLAELALRVAYITSAASQHDEVSMAAMEAALKFMEWQESIRALFQPAKGANETEECMKTVLDQFKKAPGHALNWRLTAQQKNWYRRFPRSIKGVRRTLESEGVIVYDKKSRKHYLNERG